MGCSQLRQRSARSKSRDVSRGIGSQIPQGDGRCGKMKIRKSIIRLIFYSIFAIFLAIVWRNYNHFIVPLKVGGAKLTYDEHLKMDRWGRLVSIKLEGNNIGPDCLREIKRSSANLYAVWIEAPNLRSIDLTPLASFRRLIFFSISSDSLERIDLSPLPSLHRLAILMVWSGSLKEIDLTPLASCKELVDFTLYSTELDSINLLPFSFCKSLTRLFLSGRFRSIDLSPVSSCPGLLSLNICNAPLDSIDISPLASCKELERLGLLVDSLSSIDLSPLSSCKKLNYLNLAFNNLTHLDISPLFSLPELKTIHLMRNPLDKKTCIKLEEFAMSHPDCEIESDCFNQKAKKRGQ